MVIRLRPCTISSSDPCFALRTRTPPRQPGGRAAPCGRRSFDQSRKSQEKTDTFSLYGSKESGVVKKGHETSTFSLIYMNERRTSPPNTGRGPPRLQHNTTSPRCRASPLGAWPATATTAGLKQTGTKWTRRRIPKPTTLPRHKLFCTWYMAMTTELMHVVNGQHNNSIEKKGERDFSRPRS